MKARKKRKPVRVYNTSDKRIGVVASQLFTKEREERKRRNGLTVMEKIAEDVRELEAVCKPIYK